MQEQNHNTISSKLQTLENLELLNFLSKHYPAVATPNIEWEWPLTTKAYEALSVQDIVAIENSISNKYGEEELKLLFYYKENNFEHYRREILRFGTDVLPELLSYKNRMSSANPPLEIHSMQRQDIFSGDLYSGDMVVSAVMRGGKRIIDGGHYLDFGCSSGALVRNMWAGFPNSYWYGSDPVKSSIDWATNNFPSIDFIVSSQTPPLPFNENHFDGIYAISIWSHFSENAALNWFKEMHRIIKPSGFLMFTTHGIRSLYYYLERELMPKEVIAPLAGEVISHQYAFQPIWENKSEAADFLETSDWGNSYFTPTWVANNMSHDWKLLDYQEGLNQSNQDVYVLERQN